METTMGLGFKVYGFIDSFVRPGSCLGPNSAHLTSLSLFRSIATIYYCYALVTSTICCLLTLLIITTCNLLLAIIVY